MKILHQFYLISFLLSLHQIAFCSFQKSKLAIQANKIKEATQSEDWQTSLTALESSNKHAKSQQVQQIIASVFPRIESITSDKNKKSTSSMQTHEKSTLPPINGNFSQQTTQTNDDASSEKKSHRRRKNTDSSVLKHKLNAEMWILDDLDKLLSESAVTISAQNTPRDLFTLTEETEADLETEEDHDEDGLLKRKQLNASKKNLHHFIQQQQSLSKK